MLRLIPQLLVQRLRILERRLDLVESAAPVDDSGKLTVSVKAIASSRPRSG